MALSHQPSVGEDRMTRSKPLVVAVVFVASLLHPSAQGTTPAPAASWRPTIVAQHGMVAAGHPLAAYAVQKYGTMPLADVLAPAIEIAEGGFPITEALARGLQSGRTKLAKYPSTTKIWFKDGKPLEMGDIVRNPDLARTLRTIAAQGADAFYRGDIAKNTAAFLKANGGIITQADLARLQPVRNAPIPNNHRGLQGDRGPPH